MGPEDQLLQTRKKVLIVLPMVAHEGITMQVLNQLKTLQDNSYNVYLVVLSQFDQKIFDSFQLRFPESRMLFAGQDDAYLSIKSLFTSPAIVSKIKTFIEKNRIETVVAHTAYAHFLMRLVKGLSLNRDRKLRLFQYFHGTQYRQFPVNTLRRYIINRVNILLAKRFDNGHLFVSEAVKRDVELNLMRHAHQKVIYNALPGNVPTGNSIGSKSRHALVTLLKKAESKYKILLPGRLEGYKGQMFFIKSFAAFVEKAKLFPNDIVLCILGEGSQKQQIERLIADLKLQDFIYVIEPVENSLLLELLPTFNLITLPSEYEGLPLVILEALQAKRVVLCSDIDGTNEIVRDGVTGFLYKALNHSDCVRKLSFIYKDRNEQLIDEAVLEKDLQSKFSFDVHMQKLMCMLEGTW
ncbi:glycosyltransferase family 4 protein [Pontibacter burrus]|uniref:Glycosyltransferase family 4 protein n=1 Tax=Pontibacter burrus TaxID=2704466 RepID=A0A6B3LXR1_9BACT|nr:glycosyltransferase family 4 protein [Pontibacter burrus]NEM98261.1 glycosyltransferase family 4 protein [Pontibacter burrus]